MHSLGEAIQTQAATARVGFAQSVALYPLSLDCFALLAMTGAVPAPYFAIDPSSKTRGRLGLDGARSWVLVSEVNRFVWTGADLRPISRGRPDRFEFGFLPPSLFRQIRERLAACARAQRLKSVERTE